MTRSSAMVLASRGCTAVVVASMLGAACGGKVMVDGAFCQATFEELADSEDVPQFCTCLCDARAAHEGCGQAWDGCYADCTLFAEQLTPGGCLAEHIRGWGCFLPHRPAGACGIPLEAPCEAERAACEACCGPGSACC